MAKRVAVSPNQKQTGGPTTLSSPAPAGSPLWRHAEWAAVAAILLLAVAVRISYFSERVALPDFLHPTHDALYYDSWARTLAESLTGGTYNILSEYNINTPYSSPPGYTWFLCAVYLLSGGSYHFAVVLQIILGLFSCLLGWRVGRLIAGPEAGMFCLLGLSFGMVFVYYEQELLGWSVIVFLTLVLFNLLYSWMRAGCPRTAAAAGITLGCMVLLRGEAVLLVPVVLFWWMALVFWGVPNRRRGLIGAVFFTFFAMAPMLAASARNNHLAGERLPFAMSGTINLYASNNLHTDGTYADQDTKTLFGLGVPLHGHDIAWYLRAYQKKWGAEKGYADFERHVRELTRQLVREHPGHVIRLLWRKARLFWCPFEVANNKEVELDRESSTTLRLLPRFPFFAASFLCGLGLLALRLREDFRHRRLPDARSSFLLLMAAHFTVSFAVCVVFIMAARFRVPAVTSMLPVGAFALAEASGLLRRRAWRHLALLAGCWIFLFCLLHIPLAAYEPHRTVWHTDRGQSYADIGEEEKAVEEFGKAIALSDSSPALITLAELYSKKGLHDRAIPLFREALKYYDDYEGVWNGLAYSLWQTGETVEAQRLFRETMRRFPLFVRPMLNLGNMLVESGDLSGAAACYLRALEADPRDPNANYNLGRVSALAERWEDAVGWFEKSVASDPAHVDAQNYLGYALFRLGRPAEAEAPLREAVRLDPEGTLQRVNLADVLSALKRPEEAAGQYLAAAELFFRAGRKDMAVTQYQRVLSLDPGNAAALEGLQRARAPEPPR